MEETVREILYETRYHASRPYSSNYPPQQTNEGVKGGYLSLLANQAVSQLKEKWSGYRNPRKLKKLVSLFVSPRGEHVAVAARNQITILQKDDDYREPCGVFTSASVVAFTCGTWSEAHNVLGVADHADTIYFIKANGEEITRITKKHLKASLPITCLIAQDDSDVQRSCLCSFDVLISDGSLHHIEISREPSASISSTGTSNNNSTLKRRFPQNVFCVDYHPKQSLLAVVGSTDSISLTSIGNSESCYLSLWRKDRNLDLELMCSTQLQGLYSTPKGYLGKLTYPKVLISPQGNFVATLDLTGCLGIFKVDKENFSLASFALGERSSLQVAGNISDGGTKVLSDFVDFTWWSDCVLTLAKRTGIVTMLDILGCKKLLEDNPAYSMPVLERVMQFQGHLFLLESTSSQEGYNSSMFSKVGDLHHLEQVAEGGYDQLDISRLHWSLISFSERSVSEMYNILIGNKRYQAAWEFAIRHELDEDEVLKSQWLQSEQGKNEMNIYLSKIKDQHFVLSECLDKIGPTEDDVKALLAYGLRLTDQYKFSASEELESGEIWDCRMARLQLLQFRDRLDSYLGMNMGRFSVQEYRKFRVMPINQAAATLAESGKIGALNLLFKRHPYALTPFMLQILAAIPETIPVKSYGQLLPGRSPPASTTIREGDWVECEQMVSYINRLSEDLEMSIQIRTEPIVKQLGYFWPSIDKLSIWYKNRARDIDSLSGQLDNCLCLVDLACRKGIHELQHFHEDILYLSQLIYSTDIDGEARLTLSLLEWEQLSDYEKFKMMLTGVKEENVVERLCDKAIPFMRTKLDVMNPVSGNEVTNDNFSEDHSDADSFLAKWLKEIASENKLDICLLVIAEGCKEFQFNGLFKDEVEAVNCALQCIYLCTATDRWSIMATILSKLPQLDNAEKCAEELQRRLKLAEAHIEAGRLLALYQVPKPIKFFLGAHLDEKSVKQILRLILSKFIRRQPGRTDSDWANMWRDMQSLREKAFHFLDLEYMLMEFCRGLLKAGKFSLARNYLKGTVSVALASEKAETLVIQAAREYFFSASSLACSEIWKAKECLSLFPSSRNVKAEADIIEALTVRLPNLGVTLLPMQYRQIKDPMEIVKMAITSQAGAYLHVDELIEIAKLLGLSSQDDISAIEEAIAREAAVAGDLQLAFDLCLVLAKKGHGLIWDLCAAIARGPSLENMDISSRKQLLGFALSHCDDDSVGDLLHAWKDLDMQGQCKTLMMLTGTNSASLAQGSSFISLPVHSMQDSVNLRECSGLFEGFDGIDKGVHFNNIKSILSDADVAKDLSVESETSLDSLIRENGKILSFAAFQLPWLLELSRIQEHGKKQISVKCFLSIRTQALVTILSWLARNGFAPKDDLIASLAKSIVEPPVTKEEDILGCSFLLNLVDAFNGVEVIEEQLRTRQDYQDICSIMKVGMTYSLLHNSGVECDAPARRRELLRKMFKEKHNLKSDEIDRIGSGESTFWRDWKLKLEEQKHVADHSRALEKVIPGVEVARFLSGDLNYIESVVFSLVDSVKLEKRCILMDVLKLADTYGLLRTKVLQRYLGSVLASQVWSEDDINAEISEVRGEIVACAAETIETIYLTVYPAVDGHNKQRLAYVYGLLSDCCLRLNEFPVLLSMICPCPDPRPISTFGLARFYKVLEQECRRVSFIENLNFKNIAGLGGLNLEFFGTEVYDHIDENSLEALAKMVKNLSSIYADPVPESLISWQDVYKHYVLGLFTSLECKARTEVNNENLLDFINQIDQTYDLCRTYIRFLAHSDALDMMKQYFKVIIPLNHHSESLQETSTWQDSLIMILTFWIRLTDDMQEITSHESSKEKLKFQPDCLMSCLKVLIRLVTEDSISLRQGWGTIFQYVNQGLVGDSVVEIFIFCRSMIFSGSQFGAVAEVYSQAVSMCPTLTSKTEENSHVIKDLPHLYLNILEPILQDLVNESFEHRNLHCFLSSLSRLEGDLEELKRVRFAVWEMMAKFSDNLQLPSHVRVCALELMQFISGKRIKSFSPELQTNIVPWEGWDELQFTSKVHETNANQGVPDHVDNSNRFTGTLVALRSSQLVAAISPFMEITPDDIVNLEAAASCFTKLCGFAITEPHLDALIALLEEWEGLFVLGRDEEASIEASNAGNNWSSDDWDEGWESFQEEELVGSEKRRELLAIHPLHACWLELFKQLIKLSRFGDLLKLIDKALAKSNGILLDENDAWSLCNVFLGIDCFFALKTVLLLPYEAIQLHCFDAVEAKLKREGISNTIGKDHELLILVFSSGVSSAILTKSSYSSTFSYLCYLVGFFSRQCQEFYVSKLKNRGTEHGTNEGDIMLLFRNSLFPYFISELVKADQHILAGFLVTKFMHTNASLSLVNVAEASLRRYLEKQLQVLQSDDFTVGKTSLGGNFGNTISSLRGKLENVIQSALSYLPTKAS